MQNCTLKIKESAMYFQEWAKAAGDSVRSLSRTAQGVGDVSASVGKPKLGIEDGPALKLRTEQNLVNGLHCAWRNRFRAFDARSLRAFLDEMADIVNDGLVPLSRSRYRTWPTKYDGPIRFEDIESAYSAFCLRAAEFLPTKQRPGDVAAFAARSERDLNLRIHPFADGCGRVTRIMGAWILLRAGIPPSLFPSANEYYAAMRLPDDQWVARYRAGIPKAEPALMLL